MNDLTIIYYTDGSLPSRFAAAVREALLYSAQLMDAPIISVSQQPLDFEHNIQIAAIGRSYRSIIQQILAGCIVAKTPYVALCEHDVLYPPEHFALRPVVAPVVFDQNRHRALIDCGCYRRDVGGRSMQLVIADRKVLIADFLLKLGRCCQDSDWHQSFEPGKGAERLGIPSVAYEMTPATGPGILDICNHGGNYGVRKRPGDEFLERLDPWGTIEDLCRRFFITPRREAIHG